MSEQRSNQDADPDRGRKIEVVPYDPGWPVAFDRERQRIQRALGGAALNIEHVGSTSVPGLAAKPVIDIHLTVQDSADEGAYGPALEAAGYRLMHRAPGWFEHRLFKGLGPRSISMCFQPVAPSWRDACSFATGCASARLTGPSIPASNSASPCRPGITCRTTPTPSRA